jgi:hypothetical protein
MDYMMKSLRIILGLVFLLVSLYFWGNLTGRIYFDPVCKRYGEPLGYTYTGYKIRYRGSPAKCYYRDANGHFEGVELSEIPKQFLDYVRGTLSYILFFVGAVGLVALTKAIGGKD